MNQSCRASADVRNLGPGAPASTVRQSNATPSASGRARFWIGAEVGNASRCRQGAYPDSVADHGPLQRQYLLLHPAATTGLDVCAFLEAHPCQTFTHAELKRRLGCSDRIIREHLPLALNDDRVRLQIDRSQSPRTYTYIPDQEPVTDFNLTVPVAGMRVPFEKALAIIVGYCYGEEPQRWTKPSLGVGTDLSGLTRGAFAYRTYDCVPAARSNRLEPIDVLVADGLNAQMRARDIAAVLAVADAVSVQLAAIDANGTRFWDLQREDVATVPTSESSKAWPIWRAWTILMGAKGIDLARTHKILHHKRPEVFPLVDNETYKLLAADGAAWTTIHADLISAEQAWEGLEKRVNEVLAANSSQLLTRLRMHDILVWAEATGRRAAAEDHGRRYLGSVGAGGTGRG